MRRAQIRPLLTLAGVVAAVLALAACERAGDPAGNKPSEVGAVQPERRAEAPAPAIPGAATSGEREQAPAGTPAASDATIVAAVKSVLARDPELANQNIEVKATEGKVSLKGTVPTAQAGERATLVVAAVEGVRAVENLLTVKSRS